MREKCRWKRTFVPRRSKSLLNVVAGHTRVEGVTEGKEKESYCLKGNEGKAKNWKSRRWGEPMEPSWPRIYREIQNNLFVRRNHPPTVIKWTYMVPIPWSTETAENAWIRHSLSEEKASSLPSLVIGDGFAGFSIFLLYSFNLLYCTLRPQ